MDLLGHKLVALFTVLITIFICTALPIKVSEWFRRLGRIGQTVMSAVMCFGGGFFLGTLLLHNIPEVVHLIDDYIIVPCDVDFPVSYFIVGCGFFLMLFMEKGVLDLIKWNDKRKVRADEVREVYVGGSDGEKRRDSTMPKLVQLRVLKGEENGGMDVLDGKRSVTIQEDVKVNPSENIISTVDVIPSGEQGHSHSEPGHSHMSGSAAKSIVLLLALSIDCIFEGLSLGLQITIQGVWQMVMAILSHEIVVGFGLGLQLTKHNSWRKALAMSFVYGLTCPVGIAIGLITNEGGADSPTFLVVQGILLGITGGVFLFVTFFEILMHEFVNEVKLVNIMAVLLGYSIMAMITGFGHGHSHGGGGVDHEHGLSYGVYHTQNTTREPPPCLF